MDCLFVFFSCSLSTCPAPRPPFSCLLRSPWNRIPPTPDDKYDRKRLYRTILLRVKIHMKWNGHGITFKKGLSFLLLFCRRLRSGNFMIIGRI